MRDDEPQTDDHLLALVGNGDERALGGLYARYGPVVFVFVLARVSDRGVAEEVSADVWLGCWRSARAFRRDAKVLTWLLGIAKRQISMHTRRKRLPQQPLDDAQVNEVPSEDLGPAELIIAADQTAAVLHALDALPESLAEVVRLAWLHELPYEEITQVLGVPLGTVKSRVSRARRLLREEMRRQDA
ncbi:RNA polymerase sigma factor [Actinoalloteichus hymeniacidonis]|uniref:RNA polymerase sigma factor, sigma-70 family n=1 Tax=Actinoalloteichus hymeniacidonis TaxID=340345 RepID=A0AAC9MXR1_9PSEU|nr:RNA polymerase sigma factor [Actinoalloteichus hymeniacidonis]AOS62207.1 RNA polymerase sigma factor, sigma-70 family [Actinoalloteichus hymeniacidonis]MBB5909768.1 RNA polymerase sigma-70 factor (ECF subfamily) [Actinoalloteichus hymeniacidonis]